jgi:hypothetical protein
MVLEDDMNLTTSQHLKRMSGKFFTSLRDRSVNGYTLIMLGALAAFECFNFSTTDFALQGMFGDMGMGALRWSTILALAFCGMDLAGITKLLTSPKGENSRATWYLLGAWVIAATMNAGLTWWGVSVALYNQPVDSMLALDPITFATAIPLLVSFGVWVIRILIIGALVFSFNPRQDSTPEKITRSPKRALGFSDTPQPIPSGYRPLDTQARSPKNTFRY